MSAESQRQRYWRLILGAEGADELLPPLSGDDVAMDRCLAQLYEPGEVGGKRRGGERHHALAPALAAHGQYLAAPRGGGAGERDQLGDAEPGGVEQLEQRGEHQAVKRREARATMRAVARRGTRCIPRAIMRFKSPGTCTTSPRSSAAADCAISC